MPTRLQTAVQQMMRYEMGGNATPLLSCASESPTTTTTTKASSSTLPLDDIIQLCLGDFGWVQFFQSSVVSLAMLFDAQQTFISVFTDLYPTWHYTDTTTTTHDDDICQLPKNSWAWDMPPDVSIVSEWSLECAGSFITGLPASSFFLGCLAGGLILATLADSSMGRKNMLLLSCLLMSLSGLLLTAISSNIWMYSALRFISGFGRASIGTSALVLSTELVGKRWRGQVGIIGFVYYMLGFLSLPAIAYLNRGSSWRSLYLWTCVPSLFYCVLVGFFVHESPRWLFLRGRKREFASTLKSIVGNHNSTDRLNYYLAITNIEENHNKVDHDHDLYSAIKTLLIEKTWAMRRLLAVMGVGFGIGMVYYGMPLGLRILRFNLYASVALNALSELPASLVTSFLIERLDRKASVLGFSVLSGVCSIVLMLMMMTKSKYSTEGLQMGVEMVSFFSVGTAFNVLLIYTLELFPTCVRNTAMSMVRQALVLGGVFSPVVVSASGSVSYGVFGVIIGLCGLLVIFLPETRGLALCDTMDEEEQKSKERAAAAAAAAASTSLV
ncbi:Organic cation/carnitine transporter like [Actinidia chinensis var. chinensis]|uniref:Organic cation/carnitine transporter like n=1 Tax=Actinidia chinensis var. chinensis TaxID=1590841 RepID=A0A2R6PRF7_ACTCC|nr:Organic cation/carnitine transporter like [Actinidia chinensis var. chinensis]